MIVLADADVERAANHARLLRHVQRRPDLHLGRARLRRGAGLRRVRRQGHREGAGAPPGPLDRARDGGRRRDDLPAAGRHRRAPRRGRRRPRARGCSSAASAATTGERLLVRADGARRRRPHDGVHARGDLRADAADHEGAATPRRPSAWPTTRPTASARRCSPRTSRAARRSPAASRPAPSASTTRWSTTPRSSCRWAARRPAAWARATAPAASASTRQQQALLVVASAPQEGPAHVSRTARR